MAADAIVDSSLGERSAAELGVGRSGEYRSDLASKLRDAVYRRRGHPEFVCSGLQGPFLQLR